MKPHTRNDTHFPPLQNTKGKERKNKKKFPFSSSFPVGLINRTTSPHFFFFYHYEMKRRPGQRQIDNKLNNDFSAKYREINGLEYANSEREKANLKITQPGKSWGWKRGFTGPRGRTDLPETKVLNVSYSRRKIIQQIKQKKGDEIKSD